MNFKLVIITFGFFVSLLVEAPVWAQASFGAEFNFSNRSIVGTLSDEMMINSPESEMARDKMMAEVQRTCGHCKIQVRQNSYGLALYRVTFPDGWYFDITTDPSVVEVQTKPSDVKSIKKNQERIQKYIFDAATAVGLFPASKVLGQSWAGSHIHVGVTSALGRGVSAVKLLKNFMVDFSNHSELATGIFTKDIMNAPPLAMLPEAQIEKFKQIAADVDSGKIRSINTFADRIRKEVYDVFLNERSLYPPTKYQAFNVNRIGDRHFDIASQTFELRAMRGQENANDFLILTQLIEARLKYIKSLNAPVAIQLKKTMSLEQQTESFYRYVTETGLKFTPYEKFLNLSQRAVLPTIKRNLSRPTCEYLFLN